LARLMLYETAYNDGISIRETTIEIRTSIKEEFDYEEDDPYQRGTRPLA